MAKKTTNENYSFEINENDIITAKASSSMDNKGMFNFNMDVQNATEFYGSTTNRQEIHTLLDEELDKAKSKMSN